MNVLVHATLESTSVTRQRLSQVEAVRLLPERVEILTATGSRRLAYAPGRVTLIDQGRRILTAGRGVPPRALFLRLEEPAVVWVEEWGNFLYLSVNQPPLRQD